MAGPNMIGPGTRKGRRMLHLGLTALLARKGILTNRQSLGPDGTAIRYIFRKVGQAKGGDANSFRLQPARQSVFGVEDEYMKLRNYSFNVFKEDWASVGSRKRNETIGQTKARRIWAGPYPGAYMQSYNIKGDTGADQLMKKQKFWYQQAGMEGEIKVLTHMMIQDFVRVLSTASTWTEVIKPQYGFIPQSVDKRLKGVYGAKGGGVTRMGWGKTKSGGIPYIGAASAEESMAYVGDKILPLLLAGKEFNILTGIKEAGGKGMRGAGQTLDVHRDKQDAMFKAMVSYMIDKEAKGQLVWADKELARGWQDAIAGFDITEEDLQRKYPAEWGAFTKTEEASALKGWKKIQAFVRVIAEASSQYGVNKPPRGKAATEAGMAGQAARRLDDVQNPGTRMKMPTRGKDKTEPYKSYMVTAPVGDDIAFIYVTIIKKGNRYVPFMTPGYLVGANNHLTGAVLSDMMDAGRFKAFSSILSDMAGKGYATWDNQRMQITYSMAEKFLRYKFDSFGTCSYTANMVTHTAAAKAIFEFVGNGATSWFETVGWDTLINPAAASTKFWMWFRMWIEKTRKAELDIDKRSGTHSWKSWLRRDVTPKYMKGEGGRPPKKTSGLRMPWADKVRTWHPPLYVRPFIIQDSSGVQGVVEKEIRQRGML